METYSSGEDLVIKTRKPYTITKQRERWTEEEHNRFLEALKLYGRAWQRIEEHIGTKTAVQIRSHAQKFFSKLEKEALSKGIPVGQAIDIDIPPPRPKRKPHNPYPRKVCSGSPTLQVGAKDGKILTSKSSLPSKQVLDLEKEPPENEKQTDTRETQDDTCSDVFTHGQEAHCPSVSSVNKNSIPAGVGLRNTCNFRKFVPSLKKALQDNGTSKASNLDNSCPHENSVQCQKIDELNGTMLTDGMQATQNYPRHVPVHILDGSTGKCTQSPSEVPFQGSMFHPPGEVHANPSTVTNPASSVTTEHQSNVPRSSHSSFPTFHPPLTPIGQSQDDYRSFLQISSTFSSLIVSTLLQNPAAHAAASFAATFWPYSNIESSADSPACPPGGFPSRQMTSTPSMAAVAAATVAAATAWWASHGLLPLCAPVHSAFTCLPTSATATPSTDIGQISPTKTDKNGNTRAASVEDQQPGQEYSEALQPQHSAFKSPSSDSEESANAKVKTGPKAADNEKAEGKEVQDPNRTKNRKQVDRSSCGSNTPSSSEVETDALEKHGNDKEQPKEADENNPIIDPSSRRTRSNSNITDSWKEVSEEGRLAFQALFTREVLPQSFSPPHDMKNINQNEKMEEESSDANTKDGDTSVLDLNSKTWGACSAQQQLESEMLKGENNGDQEGLLTIGLGYGKLKARRTGFKPYKRCSMEAKENRLVNTNNQADEKGPKRIRLEGEAST